MSLVDPNILVQRPNCQVKLADCTTTKACCNIRDQQIQITGRKRVRFFGTMERNIMSTRHIYWTLFLYVSLLTVVAAAQVTTGSVSGTVKDSAGAVLPGVSIKLMNTDTGITRTVIADEIGRYN